MNRDTAVRTWREVCGNDTVMAMGVVTGRMLEEFAARIEAAERERWRSAALAGCDGTSPKYAEALRHLVAIMDAGVA